MAHALHSWEEFDHERSSAMKRRFIPLKEVLEFLDIKDNDRILEIGAGNGEYAEEFARIASKGHVTAMELTMNGSRLIFDRMILSGLKNMELWKANACRVDDFSGFDKIFMSNVFHDIKCNDQILENFRSTIDKGAMIFFIEFKKDAEIGPPPEFRISEAELESMMGKYGFLLRKEHGFKYHYMHAYSLG
ncbi:MAG: class I SAM-dependent methyltransferase [Candidatus Marsarchaeota archaeon]|jgi:ubiquinone/menaquinone biosynthesis C-methylase UbiE|nr:class I SAM-dependent methyltransferase [Candidatus Marsarchaeota archaeon]MCL5431229.1 class I SAM-dependent methyltransferase [Candidatus Marsarchaeota archaeon]